MRDLGYHLASTERDALAAGAAEDAAYIAGGTELLNWLRLGIAAPTRLVDIGRLPRQGIEVTDGRLAIGALATLNQIAEHPAVTEHAGILAEACLVAASAQLRNRATIGGNVLQRTRCAYFRAEEPLPWPCNKRRPGSGCAARDGIGEERAILGWTDDCVATHPSDPLVALTCLDAELEIASTAGSRWIAIHDLHRTQAEARRAGEDPARGETTLRPGELIAGYRIPLRSADRSSYVKVRERRSYAFALVAAAASIELDGDRIASARIALGSVAQRAWRLREAEAALVGRRPTASMLPAVIAADLEAARPLPGDEYKVRLAREAAVQAILEASG